MVPAMQVRVLFLSLRSVRADALCPVAGAVVLVVGRQTTAPPVNNSSMRRTTSSFADLAASIGFYESYCGLHVIHERDDSGGESVVWLSEPGREKELILVLVPGGARSPQKEGDYSHLGFAVASRTTVDHIAARAEKEGRLLWPPRQEPYPVGYYCGIRDPDGNFVEFSFGQPLGPGAGRE